MASEVDVEAFVEGLHRKRSAGLLSKDTVAGVEAIVARLRAAEADIAQALHDSAIYRRERDEARAALRDSETLHDVANADEADLRAALEAAELVAKSAVEQQEQALARAEAAEARVRELEDYAARADAYDAALDEFDKLRAVRDAARTYLSPSADKEAAREALRAALRDAARILDARDGYSRGTRVEQWLSEAVTRHLDGTLKAELEDARKRMREAFDEVIKAKLHEALRSALGLK
jgi:hypothetical protein